MARTTPIGIDLGTTNSAVAYVDANGHTLMVPNAEGDLLTPSVVLFDDAEVVVGKEARTATIVNPDRVAVWVKRDMGAPVYHRPIRGEHLPPEVIQACILRKLKSDLIRSLGPESRVVITVPAYFDELRRKATADAGEMAGLTVLDIVNEPTAGALAFGEVLGYLSPTAAPQRQMTVMVYDLGGGTFDVTLLKLASGVIQTIATDGDVQLGGYDWDLRLVNYLADEFKRSCSADPRDNPSSVARLFAASVEAKHTLSARSHASVRVDHAGRSLDVSVSREKFEELTADLLERTAYTTRQLLTAANMQWKHVSRVLLVGGSTRMPAVTRMLQQMTGLEPDHSVNPDEAVARGAALYAHYLLTKESGKGRAAFEVTNVNAHSLGVEGIDSETLRKTNVILIRRNTPLPAKLTERFATKSDGQRSIVIQVLQGESSLPGECTMIGRTVIRDLPAGLPKGWPVEVTFEYGSNGRLTVLAAVPGTHREVKLNLEREGGLTSEGLARWKNTMSAGTGFDAFESMLVQTLGMPKDRKAPGFLSAPGVAGAGAVPLAGAAAAGGRAAAATMPRPGAAAAVAAPAAAAGGLAANAPAASMPGQAAALPLAGKAAVAGAGGGKLPLPAAAAMPSAPLGREGPLLAGNEPSAGSGRWFYLGVAAAVTLGLGAGWLILHLLRPERF